MPEGVLALAAPPPDGAAPAVLVLAVKPQLLDVVAPALAPALEAETMLVSILAGVEIASLRRRFPRAARGGAGDAEPAGGDRRGA